MPSSRSHTCQDREDGCWCHRCFYLPVQLPGLWQLLPFYRLWLSPIWLLLLLCKCAIFVFNKCYDGFTPVLWQCMLSIHYCRSPCSVLPELRNLGFAYPPHHPSIPSSSIYLEILLDVSQMQTCLIQLVTHSSIHPSWILHSCLPYAIIASHLPLVVSFTLDQHFLGQVDFPLFISI